MLFVIAMQSIFCDLMLMLQSPCLIIHSTYDEMTRFDALEIRHILAPFHLAGSDRANHEVFGRRDVSGVADEVADRVERVTRRGANESPVVGNPRTVAI